MTRSGATAGSRWTLKATLSSSPFQQRGALTAARDAQAALAEGPIHVRMGIHTGTPVLTPEGYVGSDVHRAARIAAVGHGGQVLVSAATAGLLSTIELRDLGSHRLRATSAAWTPACQT